MSQHWAVSFGFCEYLYSRHGCSIFSTRKLLYLANRYFSCLAKADAFSNTESYPRSDRGGAHRLSKLVPSRLSLKDGNPVRSALR